MHLRRRIPLRRSTAGSWSACAGANIPRSLWAIGSRRVRPCPTLPYPPPPHPPPPPPHPPRAGPPFCAPPPVVFTARLHGSRTTAMVLESWFPKPLAPLLYIPALSSLNTYWITGLACDIHVEDMHPGALDLKPTLHSGIPKELSSWILHQRTTRTIPNPSCQNMGFLASCRAAPKFPTSEKVRTWLQQRARSDAMFQLVRHIRKRQVPKDALVCR